jgi:hypothetical protein
VNYPKRGFFFVWFFFTEQTDEGSISIRARIKAAHQQRKGGFFGFRRPQLSRNQICCDWHMTAK